MAVLTSGCLCVIVFHMKTASVRQIQHHLSDVLRHVEKGHEVHITRRHRVIAKIVPVQDKAQPVRWPDFIGRSSKIWGKKIKGNSVSRLIIDNRNDRQ